MVKPPPPEVRSQGTNSGCGLRLSCGLALFVERFLELLGVLQMGFEDRLAAFQKSFQVRVLGIGDQGLVQNADDRFMITDFVVDVSLIVFSLVAFVLFRSPIKWNYFVSYALIVGAVYFAFKF